jgi:cytochrome c-type biogenesis protein CcmH
MNGWPAALLLALAVFAALWLAIRQRRQLWSAIAAAIIFALTGYALQGRPELPAAPAMARAEGNEAAETLIAIRSDMDQQFSPAKRWLTLSDGFLRDGNYRLAAALLQSGLKENPNSADLWSGLGLVLMLAGDGTITPPAEYAFAKARTHAPRHPAPDYFTGLYALFEGNPEKALTHWEGVLERSTPKAKWRPRLESQIATLRGLVTSASANADNLDKPMKLR